MLNRCLILLFLMPLNLLAQKHTHLPHGMTFGKKVNPLQKLSAVKLEDFMGKMTRISTTITGTVIQVDKPKGGWFKLDGGQGKIISVHFKDYGITIPKELKGRNVMIQGVAQRQMVADDMQHFAGGADKSKKRQQTNADPKQRLSFEATGLMVD